MDMSVTCSRVLSTILVSKNEKLAPSDSDMLHGGAQIARRIAHLAVAIDRSVNDLRKLRSTNTQPIAIIVVHAPPGCRTIRTATNS